MKTTAPHYLPENLKALRELSNHSQRYVAKQLQVSQSTLSDIEKGLIFPNEQKLIVFTALYNLSKEELLALSMHPPMENIRLALSKINELSSIAEK